MCKQLTIFQKDAFVTTLFSYKFTFADGTYNARRWITVKQRHKDTDVNCVLKCLQDLVVLNVTCLFIQEINHVRVNIVAKGLHNRVILHN